MTQTVEPAPQDTFSRRSRILFFSNETLVALLNSRNTFADSDAIPLRQNDQPPVVHGQVSVVSFNFPNCWAPGDLPVILRLFLEKVWFPRRVVLVNVSPIFVPKSPCSLFKSLDDDVIAPKIPSLFEALALNFAMVRSLVLTSHSWRNVSPRKRLESQIAHQPYAIISNPTVEQGRDCGDSAWLGKTLHADKSITSRLQHRHFKAGNCGPHGASGKCVSHICQSTTSSRDLHVSIGPTPIVTLVAKA